MADTTASASAIPDWLAKAEGDYAELEASRLQSEIEWANERAVLIHQHLDGLGILPLEPAHPASDGCLVPAILVQADPDARLYGVAVDFDEDDGRFDLLASDYDNGRAGGFTGWRYAGPLHQVGDIPRVRRSGPMVQSATRLDPSDDARHVAKTLERAITKAAEQLARSLSRP